MPIPALPALYRDLSRARWGARAVSGDLTPLDARRVLGVALHHTALQHDEQDDHEHCPRRVQATQRFHQDDRGWSDVAYHALVCGHGVVYEGRAVQWRSAGQGTLLGNARYVAVCVLGDSGAPGYVLPDRVDLALRLVRSSLLVHRPAAVLVRPHLSFRRTSCPGAVLRQWCRQFP